MSWLSRKGASLHSIVDACAASHPESLAAIDDTGKWTYAELSDASKRIAAVLQERGITGEHAPDWSSKPTAPRPLALAMPRGRVWYAVCMAAWRLGVPLVAASDDMPDKRAERDRNTRIAKELQPMMLVVSGNPEAALPSRPADCQVLQISELTELAEKQDVSKFRDPSHISPQSVLMYAYTGGTTKHSKCVVVTNAMALWEMDNYGSVLKRSMSYTDRVLQYSPAYWGAAAFGQIDIALAFGACTVFIPAPSNVDEVTAAVSKYEITVFGTVPSQLRGAFPGGPPGKRSTIRVVLTWGEKLPVSLSREWKKHVHIIDLLIASEYWLALSSDCKTSYDAVDGLDKHILQPLAQLDMLLLDDKGRQVSDGEIGEMVLSGPTLSPGYVGPDGRVGAGQENDSAYTHIDGKLYYRSKDRLRKVQGGGYVYCGRGDSLAKIGGKWVDLEVMEASAAATPGVAMAALIRLDDIHLFLVLEKTAQGPLCHLLERVKRAAGAECRLHVVTELPRNAATDKVDRRRLEKQLTDARDREASHQKLLNTKHREMIRSYRSWYPLMLAILTLPSLALYPWQEIPSMVLMRILIVPFLWAIWHYGRLTHQEGRFYTLWLGPPDSLLAFASVLPPACFACFFCTAIASLCVLRNQRKDQCAIMIFLSVTLTVWVWSDMLSPVPLSLACFVFAAVYLEKEMVSFLCGLPVSCYLLYPKWMCDDWTWRTSPKLGGNSYFRRALMRYQIIPRPEWDASMEWDTYQGALMWNDREGTSVIKVTDSHEGLANEIDFREEIKLPECHKKLQNGNGSHRDIQATWSPLARSLATLVERVGGSQESLVGLDSLQAITLAELIRKELGRTVNVKDLLASSDIEQLASVLSQAQTQSGDSGMVEDVDGENRWEKPDADGAYRVFTMAFPRHPVDWMVKYTGPGHIDADALQRACDRLVERHSALRTIETPDEPLRAEMDKVAAIWQLWTSAIGRDSRLWRCISSIVGSSLFGVWPRTVTRPANAAKIKLKIPKGPEVRDPKWKWASHDEYILSAMRELVGDYRWPMEIGLHPLYHGTPQNVGTCTNAAEYAMAYPPEEVSWYIYCSITHAYSDGASGQALYADLIRFYDEEMGNLAEDVLPPVAEPLKLLQRRLKPSLVGRVLGQSDANNDIFHEVLDEDWGKRNGFSKRVYLKPQVSQALRLASNDVLGCSVDVAWLAAVMGAVFRMFPSTPCFHLCLKVGCRDGPNERQMIGFLSEVRMITIDVADCKTSTLLDLAQIFSGARRRRDWRAPYPFEQGICVYINVVSAMIDSLPKGFIHMPRPAPAPRKWMGPAYAHLNVRIDQLALNDWDFRIFHSDSAWGWNWSSQFCHALGGSIWDMVTAPTTPLWLPPHRREGGGRLGGENKTNGNLSVVADGDSRKRGAADAVDTGTAATATREAVADEPVRKAPRKDVLDDISSSDPPEKNGEPPAKAPRTGNEDIGSSEAPEKAPEIRGEPPEKAPPMGGGVLA